MALKRPVRHECHEKNDHLPMDLPRKPCHNCRRQRLRCDRSLPQCHKCTSIGRQCLGYGTLYIWKGSTSARERLPGRNGGFIRQVNIPPPSRDSSTPSSSSSSSSSTPWISSPSSISSISSPPNSEVATLSTTTVSRGWYEPISLPSKFHSRRKFCSDENNNLSISRTLVDPFLQDLSQTLKFYISHFSRNVCKDLVIHDTPKHNPFRALIPLAKQHPVLLNIIVANSALSIANASQQIQLKSALTNVEHRPMIHKSLPIQTSATSQSSKWYRDALTAKHRALRFLNTVLSNVDSTSIDVVLASILLLTEFELTDYGVRDWRMHIRGARALIDSLQKSSRLETFGMSSLRRGLVSSCLVYEQILNLNDDRMTDSIPQYSYDTLSSTLAFSQSSQSLPSDLDVDQSSLQYAEANNYLSFPAVLLETVLAVARLLHSVDNRSKIKLSSADMCQMNALLHQAQSFDARQWANTSQNASPTSDLETRFHIASAHKAAVCIYVYRVRSFLSQDNPSPENLQHLVADIIHHLSFITQDDDLFKATSWPAFVAGVEATDIVQQSWAMSRLRQLWECLPCTMGYVRSAMEILESIWSKRDAAMGVDGMQNVDWIRELKMLEIDLMIA